MRIRSLELSWFRGAAEAASLDLNCKSMVVYGVNGAGKSSFVDAIEYVLGDGKIGHLTHEYSGKRQEKAVFNTHKPDGQSGQVKIKFADDSELLTEIAPDGSAETNGGEQVSIGAWDYRRTVLRQDEVAAFIRDTKGGKYSALLPLLGLNEIETVAENLRQLAKAVEEQSKLKEIKGALKSVQAERATAFGSKSDDAILTEIGQLHARYCPESDAIDDPSIWCQEVYAAIDARLLASSSDQREYVALRDVAAIGLKRHVDAVRAASLRMADAAQPLIAERLEILQATGTYIEKLEAEGIVDCPACGQSVAVQTFDAHVQSEQERLRDLIKNFTLRKAAVDALCNAVRSLRSVIGKADAKAWRDARSAGPLGASFAYLDELDTERLRAGCGEADLGSIEEKLLPLIEAAEVAARQAPPDAQQLSADRRTVEAAGAVIGSQEHAAAAERAETLASFIKALEKGAREEVRVRAKAVVDDISGDVRAMWGTLHPRKAIEDIRLYLPRQADKAIDIGLKFYGVEQESPRLTLSEGYRNSLGLCIFLAMAKREAEDDRPLFLDDVIVSLDRNHRGMVAALLEKEFSERQVVILTHDREWYTELRQQLDGSNWQFRALMPYERPEVGIRWSSKGATFEAARAHLKERPDSAGNDARKIMDVELALVAERLRLRLPYLRAEKNERRMAHDFLERLVADGKKCFQVKAGDSYATHTEAIGLLERADRLLLSWGNRASHTFDLESPEAEKLIDACEAALGTFTCSTCKKGLATEAAEFVQCQCGQIRWRYGKGVG